MLVITRDDRRAAAGSCGRTRRPRRPGSRSCRGARRCPSTRSRPPTITVGSSPASVSRWPTSEVVVVLPCVPATAMPYLSRISSASISARRTTVMPRRRAASTSGLLSGTADEMTTRSTPSRWSAEWPATIARAERQPAARWPRSRRLVGARDRDVVVEQHLGDAAHAGAADADEVHVREAGEVVEHHRLATSLAIDQVGDRVRGPRSSQRARRARPWRRDGRGSEQPRQGRRQRPPSSTAAPRPPRPRRPRRAPSRCRSGAPPRARAGTAPPARPAAQISASVIAPARETRRGDSPPSRRHVVEERTPPAASSPPPRRPGAEPRRGCPRRPGARPRARVRDRAAARAPRAPSSLSVAAPWLPPSTSSRGGPGGGSGGAAKNSRRTGTPVTREGQRSDRAACGQATAAAVAKRDSAAIGEPGRRRWARPAPPAGARGDAPSTAGAEA